MLQEELARLQRRGKTAGGSDGELQALVSTLRAQLEDAERERAVLEQQVRDATNARMALVTEHAQCAINSRSQQAAIHALEAQLQLLESELGNQCSQADREALDQVIAELREVERAQAAQIATLQRTVDEHERAVRELRTQAVSGTGADAELIQTQAARIQQLQTQSATLKNYIVEYKEKGDARIMALTNELQSEKEVKKSLAHKLSKIKLVLLRNKHDIGPNAELQALIGALSA